MEGLGGIFARAVQKAMSMAIEVFSLYEALLQSECASEDFVAARLPEDGALLCEACDLKLAMRQQRSCFRMEVDSETRGAVHAHRPDNLERLQPHANHCVADR